MTKICVVGLGYVGLPLAHAFAEKYEVAGVDNNERRIKELRNGVDITRELDSQALKDVKANLTFYDTIEKTSECNIYIVTVPTPIDASNRPDLTPLINSTKLIGNTIKEGDIVIYESTVYPGVTEEVCVPLLEKCSGLLFNKDFFCGYSPERINPGDTKNTIKKVKKVTSGSTPEIAVIVNELYLSIIEAGTHLAPSIRIAEASKVIENTQRDVNIALVNELAMIFDTMNIDTKAVLEAAGTKWNFIKLQPGLVGGHCIGVDPYYLTYKAEEMGYKPNLILSARQINNGMGKYIAEKTIKSLINFDKKIKGSDILVLGVTFKENCPDTRNTKTMDIIKELITYGCNIDVYDPWVDTFKELDDDIIQSKTTFINNPFFSKRKYDAIILCVSHTEFKELQMNDYHKIAKDELILIDVKGITKSPTWRL